MTNGTKLKDSRIEPDQEKVKRIIEARKKLERSINFDEDD